MERGQKAVNMVQDYRGKKFGHMKRECKRYKRWLEKQKNKVDTWWLDSGASIQVANSLQALVFVGNGVKAQVEFIGAVRIQLDSGFVLDLVDVVYVPSMTRNLISVARLVKSKLTLRFDEFDRLKWL
ncbi:unnamed protein product [Prunus armeniaca]